MAETRGRRMVSFGGVMLMLVGAFNVLDGIVALMNPDYFQSDQLFSSLTAWGWFFALYGAGQVLIGVAVLAGSQVALWPGVVVAGFNALAQLAFVAHYPAWSTAIMVIDVLLIYSFVVRGMALGTETVELVTRQRAPSVDEVERPPARPV
jgi:hypothetical protein